MLGIPYLQLAKVAGFVLLVVGIVAGAEAYKHHLEHVAYNHGVQVTRDADTIREQNQLLQAQRNLAAAQKANDDKTALMLSDQKERINAAEQTAARQRADAAAAVSSRNLVQHAYADAVARLASRSVVAGEAGPGVDSQAATAAAGMLADVYRGADSTAEIYALEADKRRDAGLECERAYEVTP